MPAPLRLSGPCRLLIVGLALGSALASVEAAPVRQGAGDHRHRTAAPMHGASKPARLAPATPPAKAGPSEAAAKPAPAERAAAWSSSDGERACFRSRRKLWQDGQGWVVKKISVCP